MPSSQRSCAGRVRWGPSMSVIRPNISGRTTVSTQETDIQLTIRSMNARPSRLTSSFQTQTTICFIRRNSVLYSCQFVATLRSNSRSLIGLFVVKMENGSTGRGETFAWLEFGIAAKNPGDYR